MRPALPIPQSGEGIRPAIESGLDGPRQPILEAKSASTPAGSTGAVRPASPSWRFGERSARPLLAVARLTNRDSRLPWRSSCSTPVLGVGTTCRAGAVVSAWWQRRPVSPVVEKRISSPLPTPGEGELRSSDVMDYRARRVRQANQIARWIRLEAFTESCKARCTA
jgi:hypothetical protein